MELSYIFELSKNNTDDLILHWGINIGNVKTWVAPDPENCNISTVTKPFDKMAVQNPFSKDNDLDIEIKSNSKNKISGMSFVFNNLTNVI